VPKGRMRGGSRRSRKGASRRRWEGPWKAFSLVLLILIGAMAVFWLWRRERPVEPIEPLPPPRIEVEVYFGNSVQDPEGLDCELVFPVRRQVATRAVARAAIEELLKGPTPEEERAGYFTSINPGSGVLGVDIQRGVAHVDFDAAFERDVAGACQVEAILAQVERTLFQFESVSAVRVTVEGRVSTALQP
jgi:hypothetical protein